MPVAESTRTNYQAFEYSSEMWDEETKLATIKNDHYEWQGANIVTPDTRLRAFGVLATVDTEVVGVGILTEPEDYRPGVWRLDQVTIRREYRRWGVARRIIEIIESVARTSGANELILQPPNVMAEDFCEAVGFNPHIGATYRKLLTDE